MVVARVDVRRDELVVDVPVVPCVEPDVDPLVVVPLEPVFVPEDEPVAPVSWPQVAVSAPGAQVAPPGGSVGIGVRSAYAGDSERATTGAPSRAVSAAPTSTARRRAVVIAHLLHGAAGEPATSLVSHPPQE
jgi:hypothetical protein